MGRVRVDPFFDGFENPLPIPIFYPGFGRVNESGSNFARSRCKENPFPHLAEVRIPCPPQIVCVCSVDFYLKIKKKKKKVVETNEDVGSLDALPLDVVVAVFDINGDCN